MFLEAFKSIFDTIYLLNFIICAKFKETVAFRHNFC
jgi:hypothetical protein